MAVGSSRRSVRGARRRVAASLLACACGLGWFGCASLPRRQAPLGLERAVWISRFDWRTADDIRQAVARSAGLGFRAVLFQVRGNGTVLYPSQHEVWSDTFGFEDPGFDPLDVAVAAALEHGVQLHAWVNLMSGWAGAREPADARQLWASRPEWFLRDATGEREPLRADGYVGLNPCLPDVRNHLVQLCLEVARTPGVAGLHLDYVRFTSGDQLGGIEQFPADELTRTRFQIDKGRDATSDPVAFRQWKVDCVTNLVAQIRAKLRAEDVKVLLSAAVLAEPTRALASGQDWSTWAKRGLLDALVPMTYTDDDLAFRRAVEAACRNAGAAAVIAGVGLYKHQDSLQTVRQMDLARRSGAAGVALFGYGEMVKPERATFVHDLTQWLTQ